MDVSRLSSSLKKNSLLASATATDCKKTRGDLMNLFGEVSQLRSQIKNLVSEKQFKIEKQKTKEAEEREDGLRQKLKKLQDENDELREVAQKVSRMEEDLVVSQEKAMMNEFLSAKVERLQKQVDSRPTGVDEGKEEEMNTFKRQLAQKNTVISDMEDEIRKLKKENSGEMDARKMLKVYEQKLANAEVMVQEVDRLVKVERDFFDLKSQFIELGNREKDLKCNVKKLEEQVEKSRVAERELEALKFKFAEMEREMEGWKALQEEWEEEEGKLKADLKRSVESLEKEVRKREGVERDLVMAQSFFKSQQDTLIQQIGLAKSEGEKVLLAQLKGVEVELEKLRTQNRDLLLLEREKPKVRSMETNVEESPMGQKVNAALSVAPFHRRSSLGRAFDRSKKRKNSIEEIREKMENLQGGGRRREEEQAEVETVLGDELKEEKQAERRVQTYKASTLPETHENLEGVFIELQELTTENRFLVGELRRREAKIEKLISEKARLCSLLATAEADREDGRGVGSAQLMKRVDTLAAQLVDLAEEYQTKKGAWKKERDSLKRLIKESHQGKRAEEDNLEKTEEKWAEGGGRRRAEKLREEGREERRLGNVKLMSSPAGYAFSIWKSFYICQKATRAERIQGQLEEELRRVMGVEMGGGRRRGEK